MNEQIKPLSDETLSAYIDGELPEAEADRITERLAAESQLLERLASLRRADQQVRQAFADVDQTPMPQAVLNLLDRDADTAMGNQDTAVPGSDRGQNNVVHMPPAGWRKALPHFVQVPVAIAASLALVVGWYLGGQLGGPTVPANIPVPAGSGPLAMNPDLSRLLEHQLSAETVSIGTAGSGEVQLTFKDQQGDYCRQARLEGANRPALIVACRRDGSWQLDWFSADQALARNPEAPYQPASHGGLPALTAWISERMGDQPPLDAAAEQRLIENGWQ